MPSGGAGNGNKLVAATVTCDSCHERLDLHGGPRRSVEYCVTCHNPGSVDPDSGNSVDMAYMIHSIHAGVDRANYATTPPTPVPYIVYGFSGPSRLRRRHVSAVAALLRQVPHQVDGDARRRRVEDERHRLRSAVAAISRASRRPATTRRPGTRYAYTHSTFAFTATDGTASTATGRTAWPVNGRQAPAVLFDQQPGRTPLAHHWPSRSAPSSRTRS